MTLIKMYIFNFLIRRKIIKYYVRQFWPNNKVKRKKSISGWSNIDNVPKSGEIVFSFRWETTRLCLLLRDVPRGTAVISGEMYHRKATDFVFGVFLQS